jgi:hypothetical protein
MYSYKLQVTTAVIYVHQGPLLCIVYIHAHYAALSTTLSYFFYIKSIRLSSFLRFSVSDLVSKRSYPVLIVHKAVYVHSCFVVR